MDLKRYLDEGNKNNNPITMEKVKASFMKHFNTPK